MTPDGALTYYDKIGGAGENSLTEAFQTSNYIAANVFGTYEDTFKDAHHLTFQLFVQFIEHDVRQQRRNIPALRCADYRIFILIINHHTAYEELSHH